MARWSVIAGGMPGGGGVVESLRPLAIVGLRGNRAQQLPTEPHTLRRGDCAAACWR